MIGYLQGFIKDKAPPKLLLLVNQGVGYELETPLSTFERLSEDTSSVGFYTHLIPREDALLLFGFLTVEERACFRALIKVNHVGPKLALSILSHMSTIEFTNCITNQDNARLSTIPGLGKKTAERLIIEMKDRIESFNQKRGDLSSGNQPDSSAMQEAFHALSALGYKPKEAQRLLSKIEQTYNTVEEWIHAALKEAKA
jgi:holliday junction DNA helicase RuvA